MTIAYQDVRSTPMDDAATAEIINRYAVFAVGAGLLPLPVIDLIGVAAIQLRLVQVLSERYAAPFEESQTKALIASLVGSVVPFNMGAPSGLFSLLKSVPVIGPVVAGLLTPALAYAATFAIGIAFRNHFESHGARLTFDAAKIRAEFLRAYREGQQGGARVVGPTPVAASPVSDHVVVAASGAVAEAPVALVPVVPNPPVASSLETMERSLAPLPAVAEPDLVSPPAAPEPPVVSPSVAAPVRPARTGAATARSGRGRSARTVTPPKSEPSP